jgi:hypothetical protein
MLAFTISKSTYRNFLDLISLLQEKGRSLQLCQVVLGTHLLNFFLRLKKYDQSLKFMMLFMMFESARIHERSNAQAELDASTQSVVRMNLSGGSTNLCFLLELIHFNVEQVPKFVRHFNYISYGGWSE